MARKRASLKDKGPEALGLTPRKGKGIDVLFGGPSEKPAEDESTSAAAAPETTAGSQPEPETVAEAPVAEDDLSALAKEIEGAGEDDLSALAEAIPVVPAPAAAPPPPPIPDSLPVNEADDDDFSVTSFEDVVDDLGLPVAMEAPPPDLELAMPVAEPAPEPILAAPVAPVPESISVAPAPSPPTPAAAPPPPTRVAKTVPAAPATPPPAAKPVAPAPAMPVGEVDEAGDLSGLAAEDDMAGLEDDLAGLAGEAETTAPTPTIPPANLPPAQPLPTAAPMSSPVSPGTAGGYSPRPISPTPSSYTPPTPATTYTARPSTLGRPPSTATGAPSLSMPRAKVESIGGIASQAIPVKEEDIIPEDTKLGEASNVLDLKRREHVEEDEEAARRVTRYIGRERREKLDQDIERLYDEVGTELSVNTDDAEFALKVLSQAQDIIFEDTRQYDEALYLVAIVRTMIARKRNLRRWSYTWGSFVFFYALVWLIAFLAGFLFDMQLREMVGDTNSYVDAVRAAWFSALAGGIGGVIGILYSLYWHVAMKQDFDRQYVMYYLVQPIMGFVLGAVVYFIIGSGFLVVNLAIDRTTDTGTVLASPTIIAIQIVFGWIAGFRQRFVFEMIDKIVQRVSPKPEGDEGKKPVSVISAEDRQRIEARLEEREKTAAPPAPPPGNKSPSVPPAPVEG